MVDLDGKYVFIVFGEEPDTLYIHCIWSRFQTYMSIVYTLYLEMHGLDTLYKMNIKIYNPDEYGDEEVKI